MKLQKQREIFLKYESGIYTASYCMELLKIKLRDDFNIWLDQMSEDAE